MNAGSLSKEAFNTMISQMDADGNGKVEEGEYKVVYKKMNPTATDADFQAHWRTIDRDGSGDLTVDELARFYGYAWDGESASEMSDDQILEALQLHAMLQEVKPVEEAKKNPSKPTSVARDTSIAIFTKDAKKNALIEGFEKMQELEAALTLGDIVKKNDGSDVESLLDGGVKVRFMDVNGEMPLHKLAKVKVDDKNKLNFKACFTKLVKLQKEECDKVKRPFAPDVNYQSKDGKTPLYCAVEHKNITMINQLFQMLDKTEQPDVLLVNSVGWTVLHAATNICDLKVMETLFSHISPTRVKVLMSTKDKTDREPLHIAAYKDMSEDGAVVSYLIKNGAKNTEKDSAGNVPSELAARSGRRRSKEVIEEKTGQKAECGSRARRTSRDSKEALDEMKPTGGRA